MGDDRTWWTRNGQHGCPYTACIDNGTLRILFDDSGVLDMSEMATVLRAAVDAIRVPLAVVASAASGAPDPRSGVVSAAADDGVGLVVVEPVAGGAWLLVVVDLSATWEAMRSAVFNVEKLAAGDFGPDDDWTGSDLHLPALAALGMLPGFPPGGP